MPDTPAVSFDHLDRSDSIQKTYEVMWPYLVEKGKVLQRDLAEEVADRDQPYSEDSLKKQILKDIRGVLADEDIIDVEIPEEERRHRKR